MNARFIKLSPLRDFTYEEVIGLSILHVVPQPGTGPIGNLGKHFEMSGRGKVGKYEVRNMARHYLGNPGESYTGDIWKTWSGLFRY